MSKRYVLLGIISALIIVFIGFYFFYNKNTTPNPTSEFTKYNEIPEETYVADIDIDYLRSLNINSEKPVIEQELADGSNYKQYIASYNSDGNKIYGLLTLPKTEAPEGGFPAIVFNHGYIPPVQYSTTQRYGAYVDNLAKNGFVVFKIDLRGHGESEGNPRGSYFSPDYMIDAVSAFKSLQKLDYINPERIGMWGHSMAGNLVLRAMEVEDEIKAGVIWAGAVYSYEDFAKYRLNDTSYVRRSESPENERSEQVNAEIAKLRQNTEPVDFNSEFWKSVSLTQNINYLKNPIQLNHAVDDSVVNIGYSRDLAQILKDNNKEYELNEYAGGGHNIDSPYFEKAIEKTVNFFKENL